MTTHRFSIIGFFLLSCFLTINLSGCSLLSSTPEIPVIPINNFFKNPELSQVKLSPDGTHIAYMKPWHHRMNVYVHKIGETGERRLSQSTQRDIVGFIWGSNERILYARDTGGNENYLVFGINIDGSSANTLLNQKGVRVQLIDELPAVPGKILIGLNSRNAKLVDAYFMDIETGELSLAAHNPGGVIRWIADQTGTIRMAVKLNGASTELLSRPDPSKAFKSIIKTDFRSKIEPVGYTKDNLYFYALSNIGRDKSALVRLDASTGTEIEVVYENKDADIDRVYWSDKRQAVIGVMMQHPKPHPVIFIDKYQNVYNRLKKRFFDSAIYLEGTDRSENKFLVKVTSDKSPGTFYLYEKNSDKLTKLSDLMPWLNPQELSDVKPISYTARDGQLIHGYLTLPKVDSGKSRPAVIMPHDGPWQQDTWKYNAEVQFLANRGYVVLQMNYRGSTGYGKKFWSDGFKQWGLAMQDDITDGVKWLISQDLVKPNRIGIYGKSYGGYAVLSGLAFTPDLYACGVDYAGLSNLFTFLENLPPFWEPARHKFNEMIGDPVADKERLRAVSPHLHADKITKPVFIAQGANDPRVKRSESDQIVAALKSRGVDVEYLVIRNEGHGFKNVENRLKFYKAMEAFLYKYLNGRIQL